MNAKVFIATARTGLARASRSLDNGWRVEFLIADQDVRCLASDPLNPRWSTLERKEAAYYARMTAERRGVRRAYTDASLSPSR